MPAALAVVSTVAAAGYSAYAQNQAGKAQQRMANYNAALAEQEASTRERDSRIQANAQRVQNERLLARQRALYAKAGVSMSTGTPLMVQADQAAELERGAVDIERTGSVEAGRFRQQAALDRMSGRVARQGAKMQAVGTVKPEFAERSQSYIDAMFDVQLDEAKKQKKTDPALAGYVADRQNGQTQHDNVVDFGANAREQRLMDAWKAEGK